MAHSTDRQSLEHLRQQASFIKPKKKRRRRRHKNNKSNHYGFVMDNGDALLAALGTTLEPGLLVHALTHRSFAHENPELPNNERLEFLGDAVLEFVVTETMYERYPDWPEGHLAKMRAKAVSEGALATVGRSKLHLGPYILLGKGEAKDSGRDKDSLLCDTVEALIGAVFVAHGIDGTRSVIHRLLDDTLAEVAKEGPALDWKTALVVLSHQLDIPEPTYRMEVDGDLTTPTFTAHVLLDTGTDQQCKVASATGPSKRKAQLAAAREAYLILSKDENADKQVNDSATYDRQ
ncbi:MAG: ribonuclease III [Aeriscardovia sp.]|nr:ribonuclease III [Aeriscardovia sp.]